MKYDIEMHIRALELLVFVNNQNSPKKVIESENISMEDLFSRIRLLIYDDEYLYALTQEQWQIIYQYIDYYRYKQENQKKMEEFNQLLDEVNNRLYMNEVFCNHCQKMKSITQPLEFNDYLARYSEMCNPIFLRYFILGEKIPSYSDVDVSLIHRLWQTKFVSLGYIMGKLPLSDYQVLEDASYVEVALIAIINQHKDELTNQHYEKMIQLIIDRNKEEHLLKNSVSKEHKTLFKTKNYINTKETIHAGEMILNYIENELEQKKLKKSK